jgi:hypothetical protein
MYVVIAILGEFGGVIVTFESLVMLFIPLWEISDR